MIRTLARAALLTLIVALPACGDGDGDETAATSSTAGTTTTTRPRGDCSAGDLTPTVEPQPGLPAPVASTRGDLRRAAVECDYAALAAQAARGSSQFAFSFGGSNDPAAFWRAEELRGEKPLRNLALLLELRHASRPAEAVTQYLWPAAFAYDSWDKVPAADRDALRSVYDDNQLAQFAQAGAYLGHRVGIAQDGEWLFFVAGD